MGAGVRSGDSPLRPPRGSGGEHATGGVIQLPHRVRGLLTAGALGDAAQSREDVTPDLLILRVPAQGTLRKANPHRRAAESSEITQRNTREIWFSLRFLCVLCGSAVNSSSPATSST